MRYNKIRKMDISNGPGVRVSIFMQGCTFNCNGCFNQETHDFNSGYEFNQSTIDTILELIGKDYIAGLSILGGEPMHKINIPGVTNLARQVKEKYPQKSIWMWTGFLYDTDLISCEVLNYIDVLVDGQFKIELASPLLKWKGSSNQRVIDVKKSLDKNEVVLLEK